MCSRCHWRSHLNTHFLLPLSPPTSFRSNCRRLHHCGDCRYPSGVWSTRARERHEDTLGAEGFGWISPGASCSSNHLLHLWASLSPSPSLVAAQSFCWWRCWQVQFWSLSSQLCQVRQNTQHTQIWNYYLKIIRNLSKYFEYCFTHLFRKRAPCCQKLIRMLNNWFLAAIVHHRCCSQVSLPLRSSYL